MQESPAEFRERLAAALGDAYTIERELGGGMARVFVARDARLGRRVVVKVLHPDLAAGISARRFEREVALAARLQHPHVVPLLSAGEVETLPYYTMPFIEGESLRARLRHDGALPIADAVRLVRELADALAYAHGQGIVHRDLKPENVLLSGGHAVLADLGVAKALASATQGSHAASDPGPHGTSVSRTAIGLAVGTPAYMAPEQALGDPTTDHRADLYALGLIAYEMVAGKHPFAAHTPSALVAAHLTEAPTPLVSRRADTPPALAALVMRLLAKPPEDRPQTADEVRDEVDALITSGATPARGSTSASRPPRTGRSRAARVAPLVATVIVAIAAVTPVLRNRFGAAVASGAGSPVRLAILPFENRGPAADDDFADGLADAIRGQLARSPAMLVIDGRSTGQYRATVKDVRAIGRELGVAYVLQGTVRWERRPDGTRRVQVRPALVRVDDAATRWAAPYTVEPIDVFQVQSEIAGQVASALEVTLAARTPATRSTPPTSNPDAYEAYVRGLGLARRASITDQPSEFHVAGAAFERAVALDPGFGVAWAELATARISEWAYAGARDSTLLQSTRAALDRARRLAPDLPETHAATGFYVALVDGSFEGGADHLRIAHELRPSDAETLEMLAMALAWTPRFDEALAALERAAELDPRTPPITAANHFRRAGRYAQAIRYADRVIALVPDQIIGYNLKAAALIDSGAGIAPARALLDSAVGRVGPTAVLRFLANDWTTDAGGVLGGRYEAWQDSLSLSTYTPAATPLDSMTYYRTEAFAWRRRGDGARMAAYCDSAARILARSVGPGVPDVVRVPSSVSTAAGYLAQMHACAGRRAEARRLADAFVAARRSPERLDVGSVAFMLGRIYMMLDEPDAAITQFERLLQPPHNRSTEWLRVDPFYASLRGHPRFQALLARGRR